MKKMSIVIILLVETCFHGFSQHTDFLSDVYSFIENTSVFELNQEQGHSPAVPFSTISDAVSGDKARSSGYISLNGTWKFHYSETPEGSPEGFYSNNYNDSQWADIVVPSNWEMQGFGDPLFRNISTPFHPDPPHVPREYNPTGSYRRTFSIPALWNGKEVFLRLEKTASASFIWINGHEVGYNEGAQEPAEYRITDYIRPGKNTIAVNVIKYSDGYYLEDQDYWRLAGIFDDVWIYATPPVNIFDWYVTTDLDDKYLDSKLDVSVDLKNYSGKQSGNNTLRITVFDPGNKKVTTLEERNADVESGSVKSIHLSCDITNPFKWSAESPHLYSMVFELLDASGNITEVIRGRFGFRETEIKNQVFLLNGVPVKLNGINSHMQHPELGHTMDEETIRKDMCIFKQFNINCVRTSHYPPVRMYLELADEYGIYVIDETGDEAHATEYLSDRPEWTDMYRERARKMVLRDRNHPCILFWSAGNESGEGNNICEVIREGKKYDNTRFWMYGGNAFAHICEEIIGPRYPGISELLTRVYNVPGESDPRPSFLDEYLAVTGNGGGALDDYWELFRKYPRSMGGAIWDYVSTGISEKIRTLTDQSDNGVQVNVMGRARIVPGMEGNAIDLNGHDQWVEVYRHNALEIENDSLTISFWVFPRKLSSSSGTFLTKGSWQFGIHQKGEDSLSFYLMTRRRRSVQLQLPENWKNSWHHVVAFYDGKNMSVSIDGRTSARVPQSGNIRNTPFPVNIGRDAEAHGQETSVYICDALIDQVAVFPQIISMDELVNPDAGTRKRAALWLDFEEMREDGVFYSYGIGGRTYGAIWPDRRPQPEMWQIRKSGQPVNIKLVSAESEEIEVSNNYMFTNLNNLQAKWKIEAGGRPIDSGELETELEPGHTSVFRIPFKKPEIKEGEEYYLTVSFLQRERTLWADPGFEVAWEQFQLPWYKPVVSVTEKNPALRLEDNEEQVVVTGNGFRYVFDRGTGYIMSLSVEGKELMKRGSVPDLWRAPLANETDQWGFWSSNTKHQADGYGRMPATEWYSYGLDRMRTSLIDFSAGNTKDGFVEINADVLLQTPAGRQGGFISKMRYRISGSGEMIIDHTLIPDGDIPSWLPRVGLEWILDRSMDKVSWYGRGPQENYPDRKTGYRIGSYSSTLGDMYEPYLIPQDYGLRTDNRRVSFTDETGAGVEFSSEKYFNFNAYPYTTENLTKALYTYQLQDFNGITVNVDYATSGVGCTALSVFPPYQVMPVRYDFRLKVKPLTK